MLCMVHDFLHGGFYVVESHVNAFGVSRGHLLRCEHISCTSLCLNNPMLWFVCVLPVCVQKPVAALCVAGEHGACRTSVSVSSAWVSRWNLCAAATATPTTMTVSCGWPPARNRGRLRWLNLASVMKVGLCVHVCDKISEKLNSLLLFNCTWG